MAYQRFYWLVHFLAIVISYSVTTNYTVQFIIHNQTDNHSAAMSQPPAFNLTPLDHQLLAMKDEDFIPHSWDDLRDIIGESEMFLYFNDR